MKCADRSCEIILASVFGGLEVQEVVKMRKFLRNAIKSCECKYFTMIFCNFEFFYEGTGLCESSSVLVSLSLVLHALFSFLLRL